MRFKINWYSLNNYIIIIMYLSRIEITNYKGIDHLVVNFNSSLNVVIGSNGCCKSSLIDAIRLFYCIGDKDQDLSVDIDDFHIHFNDDGSYSQADKITIDYTFEELSDSQKGAYINYLCDIDHKIVAQVRLEYSKIENNRIQRRCVPGNPDNSVSLDYNTLSLFKSYYLGAVRDSTKDLMSTKNNLLGNVIRRKINQNNSANDIRNIIKQANETLLDREEVKSTRKGVNENMSNIFKHDYDEVDLKIEDNRIEYIVNAIKPILKLGHDKEMKLWQNSLGYNNLIYIATVLSDIKDNYDNDKDEIYALFIEEPEAHLHTQLQLNLYSFLVNASYIENSQLFITTHSPTLTSRIPLDNLFVLNRNIVRLSDCFLERENENIICDVVGQNKIDDSKSKKYMKMLERYLDVTRSQMLYARGCVFIEGISEALLIDVFSEVINKKLSDKQIEIVDTGGTAFAQFLMLYNSSDSNRRLSNKVAVITDGDQFTDSKNKEYSLDKLIADDFAKLYELRENIKNGQSNKRVANLRSISNNQETILICEGYKTLEYQICLANIGNYISEVKLNELYLFIKNNYKNQYVKIEDFINSKAGIDLQDDDKMDIAILLWKCIPQKSTFAQDLSMHLKDKLINSSSFNFNVPDYIIDAINHLTI
ncbi:MAG: AAA family ATPase [Bacteroidales bacterium]|nr:AAA family ATPase [Bacteroidales bacterium]